jgi:hypothetical protein
MFSNIFSKIFVASIAAGLFLGLPLLAAAEERPDLIAATQWIDRPVFSQNSAEFGEIDDLVIKRSGKVKRVTIEVGGFLDLGDKLVAVPYEPPGFTGYGLVYDISRQEISKLAGYTSEEE